ncbi:MAG: carboxypeptidase regulatory-like domain-containing protein [Pirellulaceae bacterium]|nr:carboxypeptidase regulatory-like domain-containing protein [Pirellulaceae bacterium]
MRLLVTCFLAVLLAAPHALAQTQLARLDEAHWEQWVPDGKEVDAIYGDFVLRNRHLVAVIAQPLQSRNANMTVRNVGGQVIDLSRRERSSDQLSAFYAANFPDGESFAFHQPGVPAVRVDGQPATWDGASPLQGQQLELTVTSRRRQDGWQAEIRYALAADQPYLVIETTYFNRSDKPLAAPTDDAIRADRTFAFGQAGEGRFFWAYDEWFGQAYGLEAEGYTMEQGGSRGSVLRRQPKAGSNPQVAPGGSLAVSRRLIPGGNLLEVLGTWGQATGQTSSPVRIDVRDPAGPVRGAKVTLKQGEVTYGWGRSDEQGRLQFALPHGKYQLEVEALGRPARQLALDPAAQAELSIQLEPCGYVEARVTDGEGTSIPCKVTFQGHDGTPDPYFGPDSGDYAVLNARYTHDGRFRQELGPGKYDVIVSRGPEYDAVFTQLEVRRGETSQLTASLRHSVDSRGWVSADFHSHSSPSGDNTGSQLGRVLNLLAEQIEFAPCTEHNRIDSYVPHLVRLKCESLLATCTGLELTGSPLPINHQNAFPLRHVSRTQDGGAPLTDVDPVVQIERLALWNDGADKLLQCNHPNLVQMLADGDLDGQFDGRFAAMFGFMDVIEVHPPDGILKPPTGQPAGRGERNPIFHWMQMLNLGYRIPGVVNTDAHYNFHESGWLRNYLVSSTDDPARIDTMEMVRAAEQGRVVMTTGPFLDAALVTADSSRRHRPGEELVCRNGQVELQIRVQCANWLDINRVQVFRNGRAVEQLNFTRRTHPQMFADGVIKFDQTVPVTLDADAHLIVVAAGEGLELGPVMGPRGKAMPIAVANPFFVDVDGQGFQPNGDQLDVPLPEGVQPRSPKMR